MFTYFMMIVLTVILSVKTEEELEITLNGTQFITYSPLPSPTSHFDSDVRLLFKTIQPTSLLYYASGNSGDYVLLELIRGKLRLVIFIFHYLE